MARRQQPPKEDLKAELAAARAERDEALAALARERELTNSLRLQLRNAGQAETPRYPAGTGLGAPPLRYELADKLNNSAKRALGPVHQAARRLLSGKGK